MKKSLVLLMALFILLGVSNVSMAAWNDSSNATFKINAEIMQQIKVVTTRDMNFGRLDVGTLSSILTTDSAGAAEFQVTGNDGYSYSISFPASVELNHSNGINKLTVKEFTHNATGQLVGGTETFRAGATLELPEGAPVGTYAGQATVTVAYVI